MTDDHDLAGLDPYDLMATEADRLDRSFTGLDDAAWGRASRCDGWTVRDMLAHLTASEDYNRACLDGTVAAFLATMGERGVTDLESANEVGIRDLDGVATPELLATWRTRAAENREAFRARDGGDVDSSVGAYPARSAGLPPRVRARDPRRRRRRAGRRLRGRRAAHSGWPSSAGSR